MRIHSIHNKILTNSVKVHVEFNQSRHELDESQISVHRPHCACNSNNSIKRQNEETKHKFPWQVCPKFQIIVIPFPQKMFINLEIAIYIIKQEPQLYNIYQDYFFFWTIFCMALLSSSHTFLFFTHFLNFQLSDQMN